MKWLLSLHIIAFVSWFAGLFYLPRLFVYHAMTTEQAVKDQLCIMERKLLYYIMWPAMIITFITGFLLMGSETIVGAWLTVKLVLVGVLALFHFSCDHFVSVFHSGSNTRTHCFFRWYNEFPTVLLITIVILAVVKPF